MGTNSFCQTPAKGSANHGDVGFFVGAAPVRCVFRYALIVRLLLLRLFESSLFLWLSCKAEPVLGEYVFQTLGTYRLALIDVAQCRGSENRKVIDAKGCLIAGLIAGQVNCRQSDKLIVV